MEQLTLPKETGESYPNIRKELSGTFASNMKLPIHRWFRYSAGFSADWVTQEICNYHNEKGGYPNIVDSFVGSGTVLIEADKAGCNSIGIESHPFISRIAKIKLLWNMNIDSFNEFTQSLLKESKKIGFFIDILGGITDTGLVRVFRLLFRIPARQVSFTGADLNKTPSPRFPTARSFACQGKAEQYNL